VKWALKRARRPAVIAAVPTAIAFVVVVAVIVTVGGILTITGCILGAMRRKSLREKAISDRYMLPEGYVDFNSIKAETKPKQMKLNVGSEKRLEAKVPDKDAWKSSHEEVDVGMSADDCRTIAICQHQSRFGSC
jgi:hypothetical protein